MNIKRIMSVIITLIMCLTIAPFEAVSADEEKDPLIWDGTIDTSWYDSDEKNLSIYTAAEFAGLSALVDKGKSMEGQTISLENDIKLRKLSWNSIGWRNKNDNNTEHPFSGVFDGKNHSVDGLSKDLFGYSNGVIKNIHLTNVNISFTYSSVSEVFNIGALVTYCTGKLYNCTTEGSIECSGTGICSGICASGYNNIEIERCKSYVNINVITKSRSLNGKIICGGICGSIYVNNNSNDKNNSSKKKDISECCNYGNLIENDLSSLNRFGGIYGLASGDISIVNSYNRGNISSPGVEQSGIGVHTGTGEISNVYNTGTITRSLDQLIESNSSFGICNDNIEIKLSNAYYLSESAPCGTNASHDQAIAKNKSNMQKESFAERLGPYFVYKQGDYPVLAWEIDPDVIITTTTTTTTSTTAPTTTTTNTIAIEKHDLKSWDGSVDTSWYDSEEAILHIYTAAELAGLCELIDKGKSMKGQFIYLENDIKLNNLPWTPIGWETKLMNSQERPFSGVFDGNNHAIDGLSNGLFGYTNGQIRNLILTNVNIKSETSCGAIAIKCYGGIQNCTTDGTIDLIGSGSCGGICAIGYDGSYFVRCKSKININVKTKNASCGGICGYISNSSSTQKDIISECCNYGNIIDASNVINSEHLGGIFGQAVGGILIRYSYNRGNITGAGIEESGIGTFDDSLNNVKQISNVYNAGIISNSDASTNTIKSFGICNDYGKISISNAYYLSNSAPCGTSISNDKATAKSETNMQTKSFAENLGPYFVYKEGDYPVLAWEIDPTVVITPTMTTSAPTTTTTTTTMTTSTTTTSTYLITTSYCGTLISAKTVSASYNGDEKEFDRSQIQEVIICEIYKEGYTDRFGNKLLLFEHYKKIKDITMDVDFGSQTPSNVYQQGTLRSEYKIKLYFNGNILKNREGEPFEATVFIGPKNRVSLWPGETYTIKNNGNGVIYESKDNSIATVSPNGIVKAVNSGTTIVSITDAESNVDQIIIKVYSIPTTATTTTQTTSTTTTSTTIRMTTSTTSTSTTTRTTTSTTSTSTTIRTTTNTTSTSTTTRATTSTTSTTTRTTSTTTTSTTTRTTTSTTTTSTTTSTTTTSDSKPTTTSTTSAPVQSQQKYPLGDVNNDGQINAVDASSVLSYYAMISTNKNGSYDDDQKSAADVNHDGRIDAVDASCILSYYAYVSTTKKEIISIELFLKR